MSSQSNKNIDTLDASVWADEFIQTRQLVKQLRGEDIAEDEGTMVAWFSNVMMKGYDVGYSRGMEDEDGSNSEKVEAMSFNSTSDGNALDTFDASVWAKEYVETRHCVMDDMDRDIADSKSNITAWFISALTKGYQVGYQRGLEDDDFLSELSEMFESEDYKNEYESYKRAMKMLE